MANPAQKLRRMGDKRNTYFSTLLSGAWAIGGWGLLVELGPADGGMVVPIGAGYVVAGASVGTVVQLLV
jgi:hypothetical protein